MFALAVMHGIFKPLLSFVLFAVVVAIHMALLTFILFGHNKCLVDLVVASAPDKPEVLG